MRERDFIAHPRLWRRVFFSAGQAVFIDSLGLNIIRFVHSRKRFEACGSDCLLIKQMEEI